MQGASTPGLGARRKLCPAQPSTQAVAGAIAHPFLPPVQALQAEHGGEVKRMLVTEGRDRVGGNITTVANPQEGYLWEEGPNSFQPSDAILKAAVSQLGCAMSPMYASLPQARQQRCSHGAVMLPAAF